MKSMRGFCVVWFAAVLSACGGGGGDSGSNVFGGDTSTTGGSTAVTGTNTVATSTAATVVVSVSSNTISASTPGTVTALLKDSSGQGIPNTIVSFSVSNGSATVTPTRVLTDAVGQASASVLPVAGSLGADYVNASADVPGASTLTARAAFTVSSVSTTLGAMTASPASLSAYGASVIGVAVTGASSTAPVTVTFSSTCAASGKAVLSPSVQTVTGASASVTYQDKGCSSTDRISAVINGTAQQAQADLAVQAPAAQSLEFVSAQPSTICLSGSGCPASSVVSFRLKDQFGNPVAGQDVTFALDISGVADLSLTSAKTDSSGVAQVSVGAKTLPTPVRVSATAGSLETVSNVLSINAGLPTQRGMSFSSEAYNVDGLTKDGTVSGLRLQLNDRFGNAVPDGTAISLVAEGASVIPASCLTLNGVCSVDFVSSNFRPANGRVTVTAFAQGEESFDDTVVADNLFSSGEPFGDLGKVFIDRNESGAMDAGEFLVGQDADGVWSANTYVRFSRVFTLSSSADFPRLYQAVGGLCTSTRLSPLQFTMRSGTGAGATPVCRVQQSFCMRDSNAAADALGGNPVPSGAILAAVTKAQGASVQVDASPVSGAVIGPTLHVVKVDLDDCSKLLTAAGSLDLTVTMPAGQKYTFEIGTIN